MRSLDQLRVPQEQQNYLPFENADSWAPLGAGSWDQGWLGSVIAMRCQDCNCCPGLSLPGLTVFLLERDEGAQWGAGLTVIAVGEWEGPRSNKAGKC